ncbi:hypothetical protein [Thermosyntropha sp.]|uniref:hypothetical protein n=1 Tax=Thermosyntropha sp. TaxID=2740820 RepID=UPI0025F5D138|nr:hypothetical protein [Thermosyntropha sp.]MBO8159137.1 hypothetical protein [Thermosyntropha sp.]
MKDIIEEIIKIKNDKSHGASYLALEAVKILKKAALFSDSYDKDHFLSYMQTLADELKLCRPSMVSIYNLVTLYMQTLTQKLSLSEEGANLNSTAACLADKLIEQTLLLQKQLIQKGAELIQSHDIIMTCSYSSTTVETIKTAYNQGKIFTVFIARSLSPASTCAYGEMTADKLPSSINKKVIPDNLIEDYLIKTDYVITGADTVLNDGTLINGFPTARIAYLADKLGIPFYVICEKHKLAPAGFIPQIETGFDQIPAHLITHIISG